VGILLLGACLWCFRAVLLRSAAGVLIAEDSLEQAEYVLPLNEPTQTREAVRLCRAGQASRILILAMRPDRVHQLGIVAAEGQQAKREALSSGLSEDCVRILQSDARGEKARLRLLGEVLAEDPTVRVLVLCDRFDSRRWRARCRCVLFGDAAARVRVRALAHLVYDESNWWQHKEGWLAFYDATLSYGYDLAQGEDTEDQPPWDPDQYERALP
jgi:hypothetical protein